MDGAGAADGSLWGSGAALAVQESRWALVWRGAAFTTGLLPCLLFSAMITDRLYRATANACGPVHNTDDLFAGIMLFTSAVWSLSRSAACQEFSSL